MSDTQLSSPDPLPATPEAESPIVRGVIVALAAVASLTVGLGLLAGPRAAASDGAQAAVTPTPTAVATPTPTPSPIPFCDADVGFGFPVNASSAMAQIFENARLACGNPEGLPYKVKGRVAVTSNVANSGGTMRIQVTSPLPGSPGYEFTREILSPIPAYPDFVFVSFESPFYNLGSGDLALAFILPGTSGFFVPYSDNGEWPIYRWSPGWEPYAEGTLLDQLSIEFEGGYSCAGTAMPVYLSQPIPGSQGALFVDDPLVYATEDVRVDFRATSRNTGEWEFCDDFSFPPYNLEEAHAILEECGFTIEDGLWTLIATDTRCREGKGDDAKVRSAPSHHGLLIQNIVSARLPDGREFGQLMPSFTDADAIRAGSSALFPTTHDGTRFRVNAGVMATEDGTTVTWTPVAPIGNALADGRATALDRGGSTQLNDVASLFGLGDRSDFMLEMAVSSGAALGFVSVLDGKGAYTGTSDPTTVLPVTPATRVTLLEVGAVTGLNQFSGSALIANHSNRTAEVRADFHARGNPGVSASNTLSLAAGEVRGYEDVVGDLVGQGNVVGSLVLTATNSTLISAVGREFAVFTDAQGAVTGTAGQLMPGLTDDDLLLAERTYDMIGLIERETAGGPERSHLGAFNPGTVDMILTVALFSADNVAEGSIQRTVRPGELVRVNNIVSAVNAVQDGEVKRLAVTVSGPLHVLGYKVNGTGDPVTLRVIER